MLYWTIVFLVLALIAALFAFSAVGSLFAKLLFVMFCCLAMLTWCLHPLERRKYQPWWHRQ